MFKGWAKKIGWAYKHAFVLFFCYIVVWPIMQYKVSLIDAIWSLKNGPSIRLWQVDDLSCPKLPQGLPNLVLFHLIWENDATKLIENDKLSTMGFLNMWCFGRWGCARMKHMLESLGESTPNPL
jgi:hypothetical protein